MKHAFKHFDLELSSLKQSTLKPVEVVIAKYALEIVEVESSEKVQKNRDSTVEVESIAKTTTVQFKETDRCDAILDPLKINPRRNTLDCPWFDGHDFLGWFMKIQQFFEVVGTSEDDKALL